MDVTWIKEKGSLEILVRDTWNIPVFCHSSYRRTLHYTDVCVFEGMKFYFGALSDGKLQMSEGITGAHCATASDMLKKNYTKEDLFEVFLGKLKTSQTSIFDVIERYKVTNNFNLELWKMTSLILGV